MADATEITQLLHLAQHGDRAAEARLLQVLYSELRRLAAGCLRRERTDHTLQPTALVNEVYLRLSGERHNEWQNRKHFLAVAGQVMRRVLVDSARARKAQKRGSGLAKVELDSTLPATSNWVEELIDLDAALVRLAEIDERQAKVVELRFFAGLTEVEIGEMLGISDRTVKREWEFARAWLHGELTRRKPKSRPDRTQATAKG